MPLGTGHLGVAEKANAKNDLLGSQYFHRGEATIAGKDRVTRLRSDRRYANFRGPDVMRLRAKEDFNERNDSSWRCHSV